MSHPPYFSNAEVLMIDVDQVDPDLDGRIGLFFPAKAEALSVLIGAHGQNDPIKVVKRGNAAKTGWKLVAGLHRLEACRMLNIQVAAIEVLAGNPLSKFGADNLRDIQASENMDRRVLEPIERAMFVNALADAAQKQQLVANDGKSQQQLAISARWNGEQFAASERGKDVDAIRAAMIAARMGWQDDVAEAMGMAPRTIRFYLAIYRGLVAPFPEQSKELATREIGKNRAELTKLIKVPSDQRGAVIEALLQFPSLSSVEEALLHLKLRTKLLPAEGQDKFAKHFFANWERMSLPTQRSYLPKFVEDMRPSIKAALRELLDGAGA